MHDPLKQRLSTIRTIHPFGCPPALSKPRIRTFSQIFHQQTKPNKNSITHFFLALMVKLEIVCDQTTLGYKIASYLYWTLNLK